MAGGFGTLGPPIDGPGSDDTGSLKGPHLQFFMVNWDRPEVKGKADD